jgi:hypothetical protein
MKPWSITHLAQLAHTWSFESEAGNLADDWETGESRLHCALWRVEQTVKERRELHGPDAEYDPWFDETLGLFHISDVAILRGELERLMRLEEQVIDALGPPSTKMKFRHGKFEPE